MKKLIILSGFLIGLCFLNPNQPLFSQTPKAAEKKEAQKKEVKMECKLNLKKYAGEIGESIAGEVEIKNTSKEDINIDYLTLPWHHLDLLVIDPKGKKISFQHYGDNFTGVLNEYRLTLRPGESYKGSIFIRGNSKDSDWTTPGVYKITAIYEYKNIKAVSKQVELTLTAK